MSARKAFLFGAASVSVALALGSVPAMAASDLPPAGLSRMDIMHWLQGKGVAASITHDDVAGDDYVSASYSGVNYGIYLYACSGDYCKSIQYSAGWSGATDISPDKLVEWDRTKRYIRAYNNAGGDVFGEYDIDIAPGGTWQQLDATLSRWQSILPEFKTFIGR